MQDLQTFIDMLIKGRNIHISVCDIKGVLNSPLTRLEHSSRIHSKDFCSAAKNTGTGYRACIRCKMLANTKAVNQKAKFSGYCIYGLYEAAVPLILDGSTSAIVYIGNALPDREYTVKKIKNACRITSADENTLIGELDFCEQLEDTDELCKIGEIVCDYIKLLHENEPHNVAGHHWLVEAMLTHIKAAYNTPLTLRELAVLYHKSEKYMGRLFKRELGVSFHEYRLSLQLKKAEAMLITTNEKIIDISLECGFNSISYFNRVFKSKHGCAPNGYREQHQPIKAP